MEKLRRQRDRPCETGLSVRVPVFTAKRQAAIVMSHEKVRIDLKRRLVLHDRIVTPAKGAENIAEIVAGAGAVRAQRHRAFRMRERVRRAVGILKQRGKVKVSIGELGAQRDGAPVMVLGVRLSAYPFQHRGEIEMRNRRIRRAFQDQFKLRQRFVEAPERPKSPSEIVASLVISKVKRDCLFKAR